MEATLSPTEKQPGSDLSEGEIADSLDSKSDGSVDEESGHIGAVESAPPATKKQKKQPGGDDAIDASIAINFGSFKSSLSKRQLKKQRKMEKERKRANSRGKRYSRAAMKHAELTNHQSTVLQKLKQFRMGVTHSGFELPKLKTALFRDVVLSLVRSQKSLQLQDDTSSDTCAEENGRIVVVWLSMVSEKYYHQSPDHFPQLKKQKPVLQFKLEHPGSNRFAKLGLEAFMLKSSQGDDNSSSSRNSSAAQISPSGGLSDSTSLSPPPPRTSYLFSKQELEENGFPVMESPIDQRGVDCSNYLQLIPWPSTDIEESLSSGDGGAEKNETEFPIFSIDCEMVETAKGSELARMSIINEALECTYDTFVKPAIPITDYRTKFSGITEDTLKDVTTTLQDVQEKLKTLLPPKCIITGHSLENDFHAVKLIHPYVIDTSCIFTPLASPLYKPKLKKLTMELLSKEIQSGFDGHDSIEDATACMRLVQLKLKKGPDLMISFSQPALSLLNELQVTKFTTGIVDKAGVVRLFGRNSTHTHESENDAETIDQAIEIVPKCDITFVQLHGMENFVKSSDKNDSGKQLEVAHHLDSHVQKLIDGCPSGTLVLIICGSSDISKVKQFQQQDFPDLRRWKEATMMARTGQVIALMAK